MSARNLVAFAGGCAHENCTSAIVSNNIKNPEQTARSRMIMTPKIERKYVPHTEAQSSPSGRKLT
jgi:hypothetical protein